MDKGSNKSDICNMMVIWWFVKTEMDTSLRPEKWATDGQSDQWNEDQEMTGDYKNKTKHLWREMHMKSYVWVSQWTDISGIYFERHLLISGHLITQDDDDDDDIHT